MKKYIMMVWIAFYGSTWAMNVIPEERGGGNSHLSAQCQAGMQLVDSLFQLREVKFSRAMVKNMIQEQLKNASNTVRVDDTIKLVDVIYDLPLSDDPRQASIETILFKKQMVKQMQFCEVI